MPRAGMLHDYVTIQRNTPTQGDSGELVDSWAALYTAWANIRASIGDEQQVIYTIRIRYLDITHNDRITFGSKIFNILSVLDRDGQQRELVLQAREIV